MKGEGGERNRETDRPKKRKNYFLIFPEKKETYLLCNFVIKMPNKRKLATFSGKNAGHFCYPISFLHRSILLGNYRPTPTTFYFPHKFCCVLSKSLLLSHNFAGKENYRVSRPRKKCGIRNSSLLPIPQTQNAFPYTHNIYMIKSLFPSRGTLSPSLQFEDRFTSPSPPLFSFPFWVSDQACRLRVSPPHDDAIRITLWKWVWSIPESEKSIFQKKLI